MRIINNAGHRATFGDEVGSGGPPYFFAISPEAFFQSFRIVPGTLLFGFFASRPVADIVVFFIVFLIYSGGPLLSVVAGCEKRNGNSDC